MVHAMGERCITSAASFGGGSSGCVGFLRRRPRLVPSSSKALKWPCNGTRQRAVMSVAMAHPNVPPPPIIQSERNLLGLASSGYGGDGGAEMVPIKLLGRTYCMAQSVEWLDATHFAVGRWDGSLTVFSFSDSPPAGPLISVAASTPASIGVQMITSITPGVFVTSNDNGSIALWTQEEQWTRLNLAARLTYDPSYGVANNGVSFQISDQVVLVVGHAEGFVTVWQGSAASGGMDLRLMSSVDVRSTHPPVNPFNARNVRGVAIVHVDAAGGDAYVATGSEDGDICVLKVQLGADPQVIARQVYNPKAERGINAIAACGDGTRMQLLVANCAVDHDDHNLWLFDIDVNALTITLRDAATLRIDPTLCQVFNFDVVWGAFAGGPCFFSSTQEGALWMGTVDAAAGKIVKPDYVRPDAQASLGAAIAYNSPGKLVFVAHNLYMYELNTLQG